MFSAAMHDPLRKVNYRTSYANCNNQYLDDVLAKNHCTMLDLYHDVGIYDVFPEGHEAILQLFSRLTENQCLHLIELSNELLGHWLEDDVDQSDFQPESRLSALRKHRKFPVYTREDYAKEGCQTPVGKRPAVSKLPIKARAMFLVSNPVAMSKSNYAAKSDVIPVFAKLLDVSPRWLSAMSNDTNYFGYGANTEYAYDCWSLLLPHGRSFLEARANDMIRRNANG
jgi:hypothetical protein